MISISQKHIKDEIYEYTLKNSNHFEVAVLNLGGIITKIITKDKNDELKNVVLYYKNVDNYLDDPAYAGAIIGPTSGRIREGRYSIDGNVMQLGINNGINANHGGPKALNSKVFDVEIIENGIKLKYFWKHLMNNHYGNMDFEIIYTITEDNKLVIDLNAKSDRNSYINLTNHSYFNLAGDLEINGDEQYLKISSNKVCELDENLIPTSKFINTKDTAFDFTDYSKIKDNINKGNLQFEYTRAIDHGFVLNDKKQAASIYSEYSGIQMDIETSQNVLVVYTGNYLDEVSAFGNLEKNTRYLGVALEAQNYQDGINVENFDSTLTTKDMPYKQTIIFKFSKRG